MRGAWERVRSLLDDLRTRVGRGTGWAPDLATPAIGMLPSAT